MTDENGEFCGGCFHFHDAEGEGKGGTCWRYPPTAVSVPVPPPKPAIATPTDRQGAANAIAGGLMTFPVRPPVTPDTPACGEWESADGAEPDEAGESPGDAA